MDHIHKKRGGGGGGFLEAICARNTQKQKFILDGGGVAGSALALTC